MNRKFKTELEVACKIAWWNPSDEQLYKIAQYIKNNPDKIDSINVYICQICDGVLFQSFEGVDNSDLNCLIALAIKAVEEGR